MIYGKAGATIDPCIFSIKARNKGVVINVALTPNEMRSLSNAILRSARIQEVILAFREIEKELPEAYAVINRHTLARFYLNEVPLNGLDMDEWNPVRDRIANILGE